MTARIRLGVEVNPHLIGGTEHFLRRLFDALDRTRFDVVAIGSAPGEWQRLLDGVADTQVVPYLMAEGVPADVAGGLHRLGLDLVQSSYFSPVVALAAAQLEVPHVWRFGGHVDVLDRDPAEKDRLLAIATLTSRRLVCGSRYLRTQLERFGVAAIEVIPNGIDLDAVPAAGIPVGPPRVAMLAHLVPTKRYEIFLQGVAHVAARIPEARFSAFGGSYATADMRAYADSVRDKAGALGLGDVLEIRELHADRFATLREIAVFAFTAVNEGASNAILEVMALGRPVVAVRSGSNPELVEDGVTGVIVPPDDPEALAEALLALLDDPVRCAAMGVAARRRVERDFDIRLCARRYEALYERLLGSAPGRGPE